MFQTNLVSTAGQARVQKQGSPRYAFSRLTTFTTVYPGGLWNLQVATLGDDPQEVDLKKAEDLTKRYELGQL